MLDIHTPMADTDTHTLVLITTLESDLLMLNPTMVMGDTVVMVAMDTEATMATDMDVKLDKNLRADVV